jgi:hypothetical protein
MNCPELNRLAISATEASRRYCDPSPGSTFQETETEQKLLWIIRPKRQKELRCRIRSARSGLPSRRSGVNGALCKAS